MGKIETEVRGQISGFRGLKRLRREGKAIG